MSYVAAGCSPQWALTASGCVTATWTTYHAKNDRSGVATGKAMVPTTEAWTSPSLDGAIYGEPLVLADRVIVATENDSVYSLDLGDGHVVWGPVNLGTPVPQAWLPCGNIFPLWERPFSKADIKRFGDETPPAGPILALSVEDLGEKAAVLAMAHDGFFTISHFDGYAAVLVQLQRVKPRARREAIVDAWLVCAPAKLAEQYLGR